MPDVRSILRDAGDPGPGPAVDLATLHVRAQRLRRRRAFTATMAVALITAGAAVGVQSLLERPERRVEFGAPQPPSPSPSASPRPSPTPTPTPSPSPSPSPSPDSGTDVPAAPVTVATSDDGRWRLVVGHQHGGLCPQLLAGDDQFGPTFCGAYEAELDADGIAAGFGGSEGSSGAFSYGMVRAQAVTVRHKLGDGRTIEDDTFASTDFPDVRFFLVQLPPPFVGVDAVTAVDGTGKSVGHVELGWQPDV